MDAFQDVLDGVVHWVFTGFQGQSFVAHILQGNDFLLDFFLGQFLPGNVLVLLVVGTVHTAVDTVVGQVQRGKQDDTLAVDLVFDLFGQVVDAFQDGGIFAGQEHGGFPMAQALQGAGFFQQALAVGRIFALFISKSQGVQDFLMVDEFVRFR